MQANCPHCSNKIVIDDARVPDRPFSVKCPKCSNAVKFPGRQAAGEDTSAAPPPPPAPMGPIAGEGERALLSLPDSGTAGQVSQMLGRLGYAVDPIDDVEEGARLLEQGVYAVVVTAPIAGAAGKESLFQKALRMNMDARRKLFLVAVADNLKTADGTQAFILNADLTLNSREAGTSDRVFRNTLDEKTRVFHVFLEAKERADRAAGY
jgi:predicted Zn finger-like uncharacterized protein